MLLQVPRSSKHVTEDQDYVLMSVVLFRRVVDDFKTAARVRGFQVCLQDAASVGGIELQLVQGQ
jgi:V-type H+-transporting ATPase subunit C